MPLIFIHAILMVSGTLAIITGVASVSFLRRKPWWLKAHRTAGIAGAACLIAGVATAILMISQLHLEHFEHPHTWVGLTTVLLGITTPTVGYLQFRIRSRRAQMRLWHRRIGYTLLAVMPLALLSGLWAAGLL